MRADSHATPAHRLRVVVHRDGWPEIVETLSGLPQASFFQRPAWFRAVQAAEPRFSPCVLTATDASGDLQGACSFAVVRRWGVERLYAGPWGTYGGVLARQEAAAAALQAGVDELASQARVVLIRLHDFHRAGSVSSATGAPWTLHSETCQVLDLPQDATILFRDAFTSRNRNKIRKAEKAGLRVRCAGDEAALRTYARLYREAVGRWHLRRPLPERMFLALAGLAGVEVWLAESHGEPVAALLNLRGGGQIMNWGNVSLRRAWREAPNNLLHWKALEAACADPAAPRLYNFGGSTGLPGVHAFKAAFGAREHQVTRCEYRARGLAWFGRGRKAPR